MDNHHHENDKNKNKDGILFPIGGCPCCNSIKSVHVGTFSNHFGFVQTINDGSNQWSYFGQFARITVINQNRCCDQNNNNTSSHQSSTNGEYPIAIIVILKNERHPHQHQYHHGSYRNGNYLATQEGITPSSSSARVAELIQIIWREFLLPVGKGLIIAALQQQQYKQLSLSSSAYDDATIPVFPSTWDEFWELPILPSSNNNTEYYPTTNPTTTVAQQATHLLECLGVTYVKFGQALSARPDIVPRSLSLALTKLQDQMNVDKDPQVGHVHSVRTLLQREWQPFLQQNNSSNHVMDSNNNIVRDILKTLSPHPIAAASIGVVYSAYVVDNNNNNQKKKVCIKIQRSDIRNVVQQDAQFLRWAATLLQSLPLLPSIMLLPSGNPSQKQQQERRRRWIETDLVGAVDEFISRIYEELDYRHEVSNIERFGSLYSYHHKQKSKNDNNTKLNDQTNNIQVVVPKVYKELCTERVLVMEWIDGIKLIDLQRQERNEKHHQGLYHVDQKSQVGNISIMMLDLIKQEIDCTLSQLLETGVMHADPHGGNLLQVTTTTKMEEHGSVLQENMRTCPTYQLGYVDFGLVSIVPSTVQDGLICAIAQLVFSKNVSAVAALFGELQLLPNSVVEDPIERLALTIELEAALSQVLVYGDYDDDHDDDKYNDATLTTTTSSSIIPKLRFDKLLDVLFRLVPRFQFQLPPYFLNNARALSTLEGMARELDPTFNVLQSLYPYAIQRLLSNPTNSPLVDATLCSLTECPSTGRLQVQKLQRLVTDASLYSGYSRRKVVHDVWKTKYGKKLIGRLVREKSIDAANLDWLWNSKTLENMTRLLRL